MAEIVTDPIAQDGQPHPDNTTNFHNYVRHSFNKRMSYAAKKIRTPNNPTITQAKRSISWQQWKIATLSEFKNLLDKNTYTIIERKNIPAGANIIHTKMDLKIKYDSLGEFIKHKARLVILGNLEPEDGRNDYAATANHKATGLLLAIAAKYNMELTGCDIEGAFLTALIDEPIYIALPRGLTDDDDKPTYARLNKSMYGLRRSPQLFQNELYHHLRMHGYTQSAHDQSLFYKHTKDPKDLIVFVTHVDDFAVAATDPRLSQELYDIIKLKYTIEENNLEHFLGINIEYKTVADTKYLCLSQPSHLQKLFGLFNITEATDPTTCPPTPMTTAYAIDTSESLPCDRELYRRAIGCTLYILKTRPDVAFAINILCTKIATATEKDWTALKRVVRYLYGTQDIVLRYPVESLDHRIAACSIYAYSDASHAAHTDSRSHTGFCFSLCPEGPVFYARSHKQPNIALSSTESELIAAVDATCDIIWYRNILDELGFTQDSPTVLHNDNLSTITLASAYSGNHKRVRQFTHKLNWMIQKVQDGIVKLTHMAGINMHADALTKSLGPTQYSPHATTLLHGRKAFSASTTTHSRRTIANHAWAAFYSPIPPNTPTPHTTIRFPAKNIRHNYYIDQTKESTYRVNITSYTPSIY